MSQMVYRWSRLLFEFSFWWWCCWCWCVFGRQARRTAPKRLAGWPSDPVIPLLPASVLLRVPALSFLDRCFFSSFFSVLLSSFCSSSADVSCCWFWAATLNLRSLLRPRIRSSHQVTAHEAGHEKTETSNLLIRQFTESLFYSNHFHGRYS